MPCGLHDMARALGCAAAIVLVVIVLVAFGLGALIF